MNRELVLDPNRPNSIFINTSAWWVAAALIISVQTLFAVPANPTPFQTTQPDGTPVTVYLRGDEYVHWTESKKGYQIAKNRQNGRWVYMVKKNGRNIAGEHAVGKVDPAAINAAQPDKTRLSKMGKQNRALRSSAQDTPESPLLSTGLESLTLTQASGTLYNLVVLVNFSDLSVAYPTQDYDALMNQVGYNADGAAGSVKDYFHEISYDTLTVQSVVPEPVTLANEYAYYGANSPVSPNNDLRPREMVAEALAALEARGFDFKTVDGDNDGQIDGLTIIHAGGGEEYSGNDPDYIWSHQWTMISPVTYDGVTMWNYHTEPARRGWDAYPSTQGITRIGVICHETGHFLGLPDLYDTDYTSEGVGDFCLMAGGSWNGDNGTRPAHMSAWCKTELEWITPTILSADGIYSLGQVETNPSAYKLQGTFPSTQYFLIENRQGVGFDAGLPGPQRGLLIWHIDDTQPNNTNELNFWVDLEEAGGTQDLELGQNTGNDADYFRAGNAIQFTNTTTPNNLSYSGSALGLNITEVSSTGPTMSFTVGDPVIPTPPTAQNSNETTTIDTPVEIILHAEDDGLPNPPGVTDYIITSLSDNGQLSDPSAGTIISVPYTLVNSGNQVTYAPNTGYIGSDSFHFKVNDGGTAPDGGDSALATVSLIITPLPQVIYAADMNINPGWILEGDWAWGTPAGGGGSNGYPDPIGGFTGSNVIGYNLSGDYERIKPAVWARTPSIDCTDMIDITLSFYRWLNVGSSYTDHAYIQISNNGSTWNTIWQNSSVITDSSWSLQTIDIAPYADNQPNVYIRWGMGETDSRTHYSGWNIDDIQLTGISLAVQQHSLTVTSSPGGSVTLPGEGIFQYISGSDAAIEAVPDPNYHFVNWTGTAVSADKVTNPNAAATTVTVDNDYTVQANFMINTFTLQYAAGEGGTLAGNTVQIVNHGTDGAAVIAIPENGYYFVNWSDGSTENPRTDVNVSEDIYVTANFEHTPIIISGRITEPDPNIPVSGVSISNGVVSAAMTDPNGTFAFMVNYGWSGTLYPDKTGYTFEPNSITYTNLAADPYITFTAILDTYVISGYAVDAEGFAPLEGVLVSPESGGGPFTSKYYGGADITDANGLYEVLVDTGFSGDVIASKNGYIFEPNGVTYLNVTDNIAEPNDYIGTKLTYSISGYVKNLCQIPIQDVYVQASSGTSDITDPNGFYQIWVDSNWSGTITPSKQNYIFDPNSDAYFNISSNYLNADYLAENMYDLDCDGAIGVGDLGIFSNYWLVVGPDVPADFYKDPNNIVNLLDFAAFSEVWGQ